MKHLSLLDFLQVEECSSCDRGGSESYVDYEKMYNSRFRLLRKAYEKYNCEEDADFQEFLERSIASGWRTTAFIWLSKMSRTILAGMNGQRS